MKPTINEQPEVLTPTSQGMETVEQTVKRARQVVPELQPAVSATDLTSPTPAPVLPVPPQPTIPERAGRMTQNVLGSIRSTSENARKLEEERAAFGEFADGASGFDIQEQQLQRFGVTPERLNELRDIELQLNDIDTGSALTETRIAGAAGQTMNQGQREITQEQRENAVRTSGLAARAAVLQGNIETGRALARDAVDIALQDRAFQANAALEQINYLQGIVDEETSQLLEQEKRGYEAEQAKIEELKTNVSEAIASGAANQQEIAQMTDPNVSDEQKLALAQSITARGASELRNLEIQQIKAQTASANRANQPTPKADKLRSTSVIEQDGKKLLIDTQTGEVITEFGADVDTSEIQTAQDVAFIETVDSLKTDPGLSKSVGTNPLARFTPFKADVLDGDVSNFKASVDQLTKGLTLDTLISAKEQGATFGALAIPEMELLADSATKINNWRKTETDDSGNTQTRYYDASEADFKEELDKISNFRKLDAVLKGTDPTSVGVIVTDDGKYWTQNSDGTLTLLR